MTINRLKKDYKSDQQLYRDENKEKIQKIKERMTMNVKLRNSCKVRFSHQK